DVLAVRSSMLVNSSLACLRSKLEYFESLYLNTSDADAIAAAVSAVTSVLGVNVFICLAGLFLVIASDAIAAAVLAVTSVLGVDVFICLAGLFLVIASEMYFDRVKFYDFTSIAMTKKRPAKQINTSTPRTEVAAKTAAAMASASLPYLVQFGRQAPRGPGTTTCLGTSFTFIASEAVFILYNTPTIVNLIHHRDATDYKYQEMDLLGLIEDDYGDLSIAQVYEQVWKKSSSQSTNAVAATLLSSNVATSVRDSPPMTVTYNLQRLRDDLKSNQDQLVAVLNLLMLCCKIRENRRALLRLEALANESDNIKISHNALTVSNEEAGAREQAKKIQATSYTSEAIYKTRSSEKSEPLGCSSLDSLYLNCPNMSELNLNSCKALLPVLQCSKLESVHAVGCPDVLVQVVQTQVN
nr:auxin transport protein BIG [Tanacetum cinerariifolium]